MRRRIRQVVVLGAALIGAALAQPAAAQDPDSAEQRFIRGFLSAIGLADDSPSIDYRERAPLVVPPDVNGLPQPAKTRADANPAWPKDQDVERRRAAERAANQPIMRLDPGRLLSQDEMRRGTTRTQPLSAEQAAADRRYNERFDGGNDRLSPSQLGFRGWNTGKNEQVVFTGEPERTRLTQPPPGLQTPSANQPYGKVGDDKIDDNWLNRIFAPGKVAEGRDGGGARTQRDSSR